MLVEDAVKIKNSDIAQHLKLPPVKLHCSMLAEDAIQAAVNDYKTKKQQNKLEVSSIKNQQVAFKQVNP